MRAYRSVYIFYWLIALAVMAGVARASELRLYSSMPAFVVSVAPVDEESREAESSILYQRQDGDAAWNELGVCMKRLMPNGDIRFTREVQVKNDGLYHYTSRPVVGGKVSEPPAADSPPQATVVVDTLAPVAEIVVPAEGAMAKPDETISISWTSADENMADHPAVLAFSTDGGKSWKIIGRDLPAKGEQPWTVPGEQLPALIRLAVTDRAGNIGRALREVEITAPVAVVPPTLPPLVTPPARQPEPSGIQEELRGPNRSWLYYLMALNYMRQHKPADALQYYWLSVKEDPDFIDAWADIGLAYIALGAYTTAREVVEQTRDKAPERIDLMHLMGETYHAEGMDLLARAKSSEDRLKAKGLIDQAVEWYGRALDRASRDWRLSEQAASFYRLGEVCYYVNMDRDGARAYWRKILELHSPTPNMDLVHWAAEADREKAMHRYQRYTHQRVSLTTWQNWARGYLEQMDARERAGIKDLMPAQQITAIPEPRSLPYGSNALNPGQDDGRSLFSLPGDLDPVPPAATTTGTRPSSSPPSGQTSRGGVPSYQNPVAEGYAFYAKNGSVDRRNIERSGASAADIGNSTFTGGPDAPPPPDPDPYAFPRRGRPMAQWNSIGPYGNTPTNDW